MTPVEHRPMTFEKHNARRRTLMSRLGSGLVLVRGQAAQGAVSPSFLYLTGLAEPAGVLALARDGIRIGTGRQHPGPDYVRGRIVEQVLFLPAGNPLLARWGEDSAVTLDSVRAEDLGVDAVLPAGEMPSHLTQWLAAARTVHLVRGAPASLAADADPDAELAERIRHRFLGLELRDGTPVLHEMRRIKDESEIAAIRRAIDVTAEGLRALAARLAPGARENELEAEIARVYRAHGATHAFAPIVGAGSNALKLHYEKNADTLAAGQLVLVDTGAALDGYRADITRTLPVDGTFSARQREVYDAVLDAEEAAIAACRPGATLGEIHARAYESIDRAGFGPAFIHGIGHHLGLDTHDVGDVHRPLAPGAVVTIEPGVYLEPEALGVRIEDDVLVGPDGPVVLSEAIPRDAAAVERWIAEAR
jgi:Xaa-Pro aminopeptidase